MVEAKVMAVRMLFETMANIEKHVGVEMSMHMRKKSDELHGKLGFPDLHRWLIDSEFHKNIVAMEKKGRFRNERTCQAYIWNYLEWNISQIKYSPDYQLDVELYGAEGSYPDISLCETMGNDIYFLKKDEGTFYDKIHVWVELKHHPYVEHYRGRIMDELREDLKKCNKHSKRTCGKYYYASYLIVVCSGPGTFGKLISELEDGAESTTHIIPIYMEE